MTDLRVLLANATPRPWCIVGPPWNEGAPWINAGGEDPHGGSMVCDFINLRDDASELPQSEENAALIVALVNTADERENVIDAARKVADDNDRRDDSEAWTAHEYGLRRALAALDARLAEENK